MNYKMVVSDMDGTLLTKDGILTEATEEAVRQVKEAGLMFVLATGRAIQGARKYEEQLHLSGPVITYNGAVIVNAEDDKVLFQQDLREEDSRRLLDLGSQCGTTMCIWSAQKLYCNLDNERLKQYKEISGVEAEVIQDFEQVLRQGITKMVWYDDADKVQDMIQKIQALPGTEVSCCTSKPTFLEIFSSKASKGEALKKVAQLYHISREEIMAIGDGANDSTMLEYAGLGVAMANAPQVTKAAAQYITSSSEEDGVPKALKKFILK